MTDRYYKIYCRMWTDPSFLELDTQGRLLWTYLLTSPDHRTEGLFQIDMRSAARAIGSKPEVVEEMLIRFEIQGRIRFDPNTDLVLLWKSLGYSPCRSSKDAKGIVNRIRLFHRHWMIGLLLDQAELYDAKLAPELRLHINEIGQLDPDPGLDGIQTGSKVSRGSGLDSPSSTYHEASST